MLDTTEGYLLIRWYADVDNDLKEYDVMFSPNNGGGLLTPFRVRGRDALRHFLRQPVIDLNSEPLEAAMAELEISNSTTIPSVHLTEVAIKKFGWGGNLNVAGA